MPTVGFIGLGIMGSAMMRNVAEAGFAVCGFDLLDSALARLDDVGGRRCATPAAVGGASDYVIVSLATAAAYEEAVLGPGGVVAGLRNGAILLDTNTLPLAQKMAARDAAAARGAAVLDCPVSGTGEQAVKREITVFVSGEQEAADACAALFRSFTRSQRYLGAFGNGIKMKFLTNYLVNIHGAAAAEVMALGERAGLDPQMTYDTLCDSAGVSRILQLRGPYMLAGNYDQPTARVDLLLKDLDLIGAFAADHRSPGWLFDAAKQYYRAAGAQGLGHLDVAAVYRVVRGLAGLPSDG